MRVKKVSSHALKKGNAYVTAKKKKKKSHEQTRCVVEETKIDKG